MSTSAVCPAWCDDHESYSDTSDDWHKSADVESGGHTFYGSDGTVSGDPRVFFVEQASDDGISLDDAETFANALLALVASVRRG